MAEIDLIKISELPATSTIGDADELAVVQGGATKKVPYSVLKAGAEVTPDTTLSEAGVPADAAAVGAALALKANQAAVTQALAAKADKTEVTDISGDIAELASVVETKADQTALNQKADKTTTDALRQDLTTLNGIVSQKADKTELNTQIGNVTAELATKANTADVNNLLAAKANVASPVFTGRPQAPTAAKGTATLQLATTAFVQNAIDDKQDTLTFDVAPTQGSTNPVTSGGVYTALEDAKDEAETAIGEVREESEEATAEAREIALKAFATPTASGQLLTLTDGADGIPAKKLTLSLAPHQSGSGDPSPDNVRPISGYESVKLYRTGKNILENGLVDATVHGVTYTKTADGNGITASGTVENQSDVRVIQQNLVLPNGTYLLSGGTEHIRLRINRYDKDDTLINRITNTGGDTSFAVDDTVGRIYVGVNPYPTGETVEGTVYPMIRPAVFSDAEYEPYTGEKYDITIPTAAGTVYGGSLEINEDGSGTLTVDRKLVTINGTEAIIPSTVNRFFIDESDAMTINATNQTTEASVVCDRLRSTSWGEQGKETLGDLSCAPKYGKGIAFRDDNITTADAWKSYFTSNPTQFVYKLASPTVYNFTANQITTLLSNNTLWMDADGTIDLAYRADTTLYISNLITGIRNNIAYIEDGMTASRAYSVGQFVLIGGQLYKVTASIASGATFTIGTNVTATTVGTELTAFN